MTERTRLHTLGISLCVFLMAKAASAGLIQFSSADFGTTTAFNNVQTFSFLIDIAGPLAPGVYSDPTLNGVEYSVSGSLPSGSPSGFPAFNLQRTITGTDFYAQGSSLSFEISGSADLSDGLQVSELVGVGPVFTFDGREVGTGRYHPALLVLNSDGTGSIRNSNNMGGVNPSSMQVVDVDFGEEYITDLTFVPSELTLAAAVPESTSLPYLCTFGMIGILLIRRFTS